MKRILWILPGVALFFIPQTVSAHAFGQLYNLPVPFWMYLYGGAAAIVLSFLLIGYFIGNTDEKMAFNSLPLTLLTKILTNQWVLVILKIISVSLFSFTIITGLFGIDFASVNFSMNFFWIIFVLGYTYVVALFGNSWNVINPWKMLTQWLPAHGMYTYPTYLSYYPALIIYILFICIELFGYTTPFSLSLILLLYTLLTLLGSFMWGTKIWFTYGEFFSVFYELLGGMGVVYVFKKRLYLRKPMMGLLELRITHVSLVVFILFMLSSTAYDGIHSTSMWVLLASSLPTIIPFDGYQVLGLLLSHLLFWTLYVVSLCTAKVLTKSSHSLKEFLRNFAPSLIPIALAYNVAHYYTLLITEGQNMIRIISDPFGFGWNVFGTADAFDTYIPPANFIWHSQVLVILVGHIVGVYIAHLIALSIFSSHKKALLSQVPMLLLMVSYTMIGLWILSQPLTAGN